MPQDATTEPPRYRRPSRRRLITTLRTLKSLLPSPTSNGGAEDVADFLERLVENCELMFSPQIVRSAGAPGIGAMDLPPSPPRSPHSDDEANDGNQLGNLSVFSKAAIDDLTDQLCSLEPQELI